MRIVLCNGCFDILHWGHLKHLEAADDLGDWLIVSVTRDEFVNKGSGRPVFPLEKRMDMLSALRCVDEVIPTDSAMDAIKRIRPGVYVKGAEYKGKLPEQSLVESIGGIVVFTETPVYSSTALVPML